MENRPIIESADDWEGLYQEESTRWERGEINPALQVWLERGQLTPGRALIPGCGRSQEPAHLARLGFEVTGLDFAPSAITHQNELLQTKHAGLKLNFELADVLTWRTPARFDAVYEQTCLCALQPKYRADYAGQLHRWLKPGGKLYALFMQHGREGGPPFHCELDTMRSIFSADQWRWGKGNNAVDHFNDKTELGYILTRL